MDKPPGDGLRRHPGGRDSCPPALTRSWLDLLCSNGSVNYYNLIKIILQN
jgi:hypothetical protein